jgi:hypothetical protein
VAGVVVTAAEHKAMTPITALPVDAEQRAG